jgi:adenylate cyclase
MPVGGGDAIPLIRATLTVGRRESCDICMKFPNISGLHCELSFKDGYWFIRDLGSTNGIKVNGVRVQEKLIYPKDEISIGKRGYVISYNLPAGKRALEEVEEDIMGQSLLEKAGLERPKRFGQKKTSSSIDIAEFLLSEDDDKR